MTGTVEGTVGNEGAQGAVEAVQVNEGEAVRIIVEEADLGADTVPDTVDTVDTVANTELKNTVPPINIDSTQLDMSKEDMIKEINRLKSSISSLASNIRDTRHVVERYNNDNQYLQDYVGTLMKNNDLKK